MNAVIILAQDEAAGTVTISRADLDALIASVEDAEDVEAIRQHQAHVSKIGIEAHRADCLTGDEMRRMLGGESPIRVWREKRNMTQVSLAAAAAVAQSSIAMLESGQRTPSLGVLKKLAAVLDVGIDDLAA
ncbi:MAG: helix-turn-helix domain-containing protein [Janthinobacterium lividum]